MESFIENYFALSTNLLKKDLKRAREGEPVEGYLNILNQGKPSVLDYKVEYEDDKAYLEVFFAEEPQRILLSEEELRFGTRTYLTCGCGRRVNALYLKLGYFACCHCQKMHYRSTRINTTSEHGRFLQLQNKRLKLMEMREKISRPIYKGHWTKHFLHWLGLCSKAGMFDEVINAQKTMEAIKGS